MSQVDAIYTRQSVDREDSISVESQVEFCKKEVIGQNIEIYTDKGYSGKNTERPAFQRLLKDIEAGKIKRVIVYRLDRMSRSVLDFANLMDIFQKYDVDFVSATERFDTGAPIGKAMLMIIMIFAQLERETIQQRIIDAYDSRSKKGFYMGGRVPLGFNLKETTIDGTRTKMYNPIDEEVNTVRLIFSMYSEPQTSFGDVVKYLTEHNIVARDGRIFTRSRIRDIVINPVYVKADYKLYEFFKAQGTNISNSIEEFIGTNGAYLYSGDNKKRKSISLVGHTLVLAPHEGLVDSDTWIKCRSKCLNNQSVAKPVKARATWLAGKIKCATCGYALSAKTYHCKTKSDNRYYLCTNKYNRGNCNFGSLNADVVDKIVLEEMKKKLSDFKILSRQQESNSNLQVVKLRTRIDEIDKEISTLVNKIVYANEAVMEYVNNRVEELDAEKKDLYSKISQLCDDNSNSIAEITNYMERWDDLSISDKITVVDALIERIDASKEKLEIKWKI